MHTAGVCHSWVQPQATIAEAVLNLTGPRTPLLQWVLRVVLPHDHAALVCTWGGRSSFGGAACVVLSCRLISLCPPTAGALLLLLLLLLPK